jgi:hypothetical protein
VSYLLNRLRADAGHAAELSRLENEIGHGGTKGRHRELLVDHLLRPWLPLCVSCGTGLIIDQNQKLASASQDDVIVYDPLLVPPVLATGANTEGVFLYDSVYFRIEVKSVLRREHIRDFVNSCEAMRSMTGTVEPSFHDTNRHVLAPMNALVAFSSEIADGKDLRYLVDAISELHAPTPGLVSLLCVANRGFWKVSESQDAGTATERDRLSWHELQASDRNDPLAYFVGILTNTCFIERSKRLGMSPARGGGVGLYLPQPYTAWRP